MPCWHWFSEWGNENVNIMFASNGSQYYILRYWQPLTIEVTKYGKGKIVDASMMYGLKMCELLSHYLLCLEMLPICWFCTYVTNWQCSYHTEQNSNHWSTVGVHWNVFAIQYSLPSMEAYWNIWRYWVPYWQIKPRPIGVAECSNILVFNTPILSTFIYLVKWFILAAINLVLY